MCFFNIFMWIYYHRGYILLVSSFIFTKFLIFSYFLRVNLFFILLFRYDVQVNGMIGLIGGFLVGLKQLIPEHLVSLTFCRVKHIPSLFLLLSFVCFVLFESQSQFLLVLYGSFISWIHLRFYKYQDGLRGDRSETFSFASFFPEFIQLSIFFTLVFFF